MGQVESGMKATIRDVAYKAVLDYIKPDVTRGQWMQTWPGMLVLNCSQLWWTAEMEESIHKKGNDGA